MFPIRRTVVIHGVAKVHRIEEDTEVNCLRCGRPFRISRVNIFRYEGEDDMQEVLCPKCGYSCAVLYYFDQAESK